MELKFVAESREKLQFMLKFGTRVCLGCGKTETQRKGRLVPSALLRCCLPRVGTLSPCHALSSMCLLLSTGCSLLRCHPLLGSDMKVEYSRPVGIFIP